MKCLAVRLGEPSRVPGCFRSHTRTRGMCRGRPELSPSFRLQGVFSVPSYGTEWFWHNVRRRPRVHAHRRRRRAHITSRPGSATWPVAASAFSLLLTELSQAKSGPLVGVALDLLCNAVRLWQHKGQELHGQGVPGHRAGLPQVRRPLEGRALRRRGVGQDLPGRRGPVRQSLAILSSLLDRVASGVPSPILRTA